MSESERAMICESIIMELENLELMCFGLCTKLKDYSSINYKNCICAKCSKIRNMLKKIY